MSEPRGRVDPLDRRRTALGSYADGVDRGAAAMRSAVAGLGAADRARLQGRVEGLLGRLDVTVEGMELEYAAHRVALVGARGAPGRATRLLLEYGNHFGPERIGQIRDRGFSLRQFVRRQSVGWQAAQKAAFRDPLPSEARLAQAIGPRAEAYAPLAALGLALRRVELATETTAEPRERGDRDPDPTALDAGVGADPTEPQLVMQMRRFLGPEFADVEQIASVLDNDVRNRSDGWIKARQTSFRSDLETPFLESRLELHLLENRRDGVDAEIDHDLPPAQAESGGEIDLRIESLRAAWAKEHGSLAAVYLSVERVARERERAAAREASGPEAAAAEHDPRATEFSVRAGFLEARPSLGKDRARAIDDATKTERDDLGGWSTTALQAQRDLLGNSLEKFAEGQDAQLATALAIEDELRGRGLELPSPLPTEKGTPNGRVPEPAVVADVDIGM
jgi:hypothetical protein